MTVRDDPAVPVVVVGAGPTGVGAALLLDRLGVSSLLLERHPAAHPQPRAVHLDDEVCRILGRAGIGEEFARLSRPGLGLRLLDRRMEVLAEFSREGTGRHGHPQANMFDQPDLEAALRANLARRPGVRFRSGAEVRAIRPDGGGAVVEYADVDGSHTVRAGFVLGCDGANSFVRDAIGARMRSLGFRQRWLVVDVDTDAELGHWEGVHQVCDPERAATYMRVGRRRHRWEFRLREDERAADLSRPRVRELIHPWTAGLGPEDLRIVRVAEYTFRACVADRWRRGPVFLLGDAAHLTPPFIGQGLGAGLRDADNLSWKLAAVRDGAPDRLLDSYQTERHAHASAVIRLAVATGLAMTAGGRTGERLRQIVAPRLRLLPGLRERLTDSATPRLRRSAAVEGRLSGPLPGTLCPNLPLSDGRRFDERAPGFALVSAAFPGWPELRRAAAEGVTWVDVEESEGLGRWLARGGATAALVRPDDTVMAAGRSAADLLDLVPARTAVTSVREGPRPATRR